MSTAPDPPYAPVIAIRPATADDAAAIRRIAALDSAPVPDGELLLGIVDGEPLAAVAVDRPGIAIADPFRRTAGLVELLSVRAARLRDARALAARGRTRPGRVRRALRGRALSTGR